MATRFVSCLIALILTLTSTGSLLAAQAPQQPITLAASTPAQVVTDQTPRVGPAPLLKNVDQIPAAAPNAEIAAALASATQIVTGMGHTCALTPGGGVKCWGYNSGGQVGDGTMWNNRTIPMDVIGLASGAQALTAGWAHTCALTTSGGVKCWGWNGRGQLGDGTTTDRATPVNVSGLTSGVTAIAAGADQTCALMTGGGVKCWGYNYFGQLGNSTTTDSATPVDVSGLASGVSAIDAGWAHTCALMATGGVKCWGWNNIGQLGDGTTTDRAIPGDVNGLPGGVSALAAGDYHTCALTTGGGVKCWGADHYGQLGDGATTTGPALVNVSGLGSGVIAIASGGWHTCALTTDGAVKCWGYNSDGQLGDGTLTNRATPVDVIGLASKVLTLAAGGEHTCALTAGGWVRCWGWNTYGQLGDGTTIDRKSPMSGILALAAGDEHTCTLTTGGGVKCWGANSAGQLGDGTLTHRATPVDVSGLTSGVVALAAGGYHTCAVMDAGHGGGVKCWGANSAGQLGDGTTAQRATPVDVSGLASGVLALTAGREHTCALTAAGEAKCWGQNGRSQLGDGTTTNSASPVDVSGLASGALTLAAGKEHTCAQMDAGHGGGVRCWGANGFGQLGDGTTIERVTPVDVSGLAGGALTIVAGADHTCALMASGGVKCWGANTSGQLGDGTTTQRVTPVAASGLASGVQTLAAGEGHTCALTTDGGVKCWGHNYSGQLGDGTTTNRVTFIDVSGLANGVLTLAAGGYHTCALTALGGIRCWGWNNAGQVGDGTTNTRYTSVGVFGLASEVLALSVGGEHACALRTGGGVKCWGRSDIGQLGDGSVEVYRYTPADVSGLASGVATLAAGGAHTCALMDAVHGGGVKCWGWNQYGQLGDGTTTNRAAPVDVNGLASGVTALASGGEHTCALTTAGGVQCWGETNLASWATAQRPAAPPP